MAVTDLPVCPMLIAGQAVAGSTDPMDPSGGDAVGSAPPAGVDRAVSAARAQVTPPAG